MFFSFSTTAIGTDDAGTQGNIHFIAMVPILLASTLAPCLHCFLHWLLAGLKRKWVSFVENTFQTLSTQSLIFVSKSGWTTNQLWLYDSSWLIYHIHILSRIHNNIIMSAIGQNKQSALQSNFSNGHKQMKSKVNSAWALLTKLKLNTVNRLYKSGGTILINCTACTVTSKIYRY